MAVASGRLIALERSQCRCLAEVTGYLATDFTQARVVDLDYRDAPSSLTERPWDKSIRLEQHRV